MRIAHKPDVAEDGTVQPTHTVEIVCANCGYDLHAGELAATKCADCGADLELRRNATVQVTALPPMLGGVN
jgi:DNA-directed RNA polymerase subunit RPC12/RpoP